jgi:gas vesicle protein
MNKDSLLSFFMGLGVGTVVGLLVAPRSGTETRGLIVDKADEGRELIRTRSLELRDEAGELVERGREVLSRQRENLAEALDAGRQAYREKVQSLTAEPELPTEAA